MGVVEKALERIPNPGVFTFYMNDADGVQHAYWHHREPTKYFGVSARDAATGSDIIRRTYIELDESLGKILALLPPDMAVMVVSDHGAEAVFGQFGTIGGHSNGPAGVLILHGPGIKRNHELHDVHVNDLMPTICYIRGLDVAKDWAGRTLLRSLRRGRAATGRVRQFIRSARRSRTEGTRPGPPLRGGAT